MAYIPNTEKDREEMLKVIGVETFSELLRDIPEKFQLKELLDLDQPLSELEVNKKLMNIASQNISLNEINSFLGGGIYDHFIPAAVDTIISRPEFLTAYTPYQAEVSQGTLQAIYEYQSLICELTGMDISNAGMYDGASAVAEAILMASRKNRLNKVLVSATLNPLYIDVIHTYTEGVGIDIEIIPAKDGLINIEILKSMLDETICCVVLQTPNYFGCLEDCFEVDKIVHALKKTLFITVVDPISLAIINAPSEYNSDIVVGEGQALGNKPNFGGPLLGFLAAKMELNRIIPGRVVGATEDTAGNTAYSLTLQGREQHIRRDKATSNICSNEALCALAGTVYMCLMGKNGLKEAAELSMKNAHYLAREIEKIDGYSLAFDAPFFKEFTINTPIDPQEIIERLKEYSILPGIDLISVNYENKLLIAVTEKKSKIEMDDLITALREVTNVSNI